MRRSGKTEFVAARFRRPLEGPVFSGVDPMLSEGVGWSSNGGRGRLHPDRSLPFSLDIALPRDLGQPLRLNLVGIFARHVGGENDAAGALGASVQAMWAGQPVFRLDLVSGCHYRDPLLGPVELRPGDGTELRTIGQLEMDEGTLAVDQLSIDLPPETSIDSFRFRDLGTPASFVLFDAYVEVRPADRCPFHPAAGGVALAEVAGIVRVGDRVRMKRALDQLEESVLATADLDEARGEALTFLALVTSATLEMGGDRSMHRAQLEAARALERMPNGSEIVAYVRDRVNATIPAFGDSEANAARRLIDRALALVERNFALKLSDDSVAAQLGLSTSHFRYLFRSVTGQPFHKYLVAYRLERARQILSDDPDRLVSEVARAVGFQGLAHFSRAFSSRFASSPTALRKK